MATTSIVRHSDSDIERLAAALGEKAGAQLAEIAARLSAIEARLPEKKTVKKKPAAERAGQVN